MFDLSLSAFDCSLSVRMLCLKTKRFQPLLPLVGSIVTVELYLKPRRAAVSEIEMSTVSAELALTAQLFCLLSRIRG